MFQRLAAIYEKYGSYTIQVEDLPSQKTSAEPQAKSNQPISQKQPAQSNQPIAQKKPNNTPKQQTQASQPKEHRVRITLSPKGILLSCLSSWLPPPSPSHFPPIFSSFSILLLCSTPSPSPPFAFFPSLSSALFHCVCALWFL